jgi:hypothetical protein
VIIGRYTGGLLTELLLDRGLGAAGVTLSPAPVKGVLGGCEEACAQPST